MWPPCFQLIPSLKARFKGARKMDKCFCKIQNWQIMKTIINCCMQSKYVLHCLCDPTSQSRERSKNKLLIKFLLRNIGFLYLYHLTWCYDLEDFVKAVYLEGAFTQRRSQWGYWLTGQLVLDGANVLHWLPPPLYADTPSCIIPFGAFLTVSFLSSACFFALYFKSKVIHNPCLMKSFSLTHQRYHVSSLSLSFVRCYLWDT